MNLNNVKAIVLQIRKHSETDISLICITPKLGKIFVRAPRAADLNSKLRSFCQILTSGTISLQRSKNDISSYYLRQAVIDNAYQDIKRSELKLASACYITSLVSSLSEYGQAEEHNFGQLYGFLEALNLITETVKLNFLHVVMIVRLLAVNGFGHLPEWCSKCDSSLSSVFYYGKNRGVFLCEKCQNIKDIRIAEETILQWHNLLKIDLVSSHWVELSADFIELVEDYVRIVLGQEVKGREYLRLIRGF